MTGEPHFDVVVVGGGSAGCSAAVAAARTGANTLLIERYGFLGGTGSAVLDTFYGFFTPGDAGDARQVVGGVGWEVVQELRSSGAAITRPNTYGAGVGITYNPEALKVVWDRLVESASCDLLLHSSVIGVERSPDGWRLEIATRTERRTVDASFVIDASGDAQIATWAGAASEPVDARKLQSLTTTFRLVNVNENEACSVPHSRLIELMSEAKRDGYALSRLDGSVHITPVHGSMVTNMVRISGLDPLDPAELTRAEVAGRKQAFEYARFLRERVPGYAHADLVGLSTYIGVRESRRVVGDYTLTREDVLRACTFPDGVALSGAPIEDHVTGTGTVWEYLPPGATVDIPLSSLLPKGCDRLLVAGRCLSATHDAHASLRSMAQCMAMGQAAGTASALAIREGDDLRALKLEMLREMLTSHGAILS